MKSIREIYRIGQGPSSSHTMGPRKAAEAFLARHPEATSFEVTLYGSLAATGKGHMTDVAIMNAFADHAPVRILWEPKIFLPFHPNGMLFKAMDANGNITEHWTVYSIGGGALAEEGKTLAEGEDIYAMDSLVDIMHWCERTGRSYWEYVQMCEDSSLWDYLSEVWKTMEAAVCAASIRKASCPVRSTCGARRFLLHQGIWAQGFAPFARTGIRLRPRRQ